jgi:hypothetical protein
MIDTNTIIQIGSLAGTFIGAAYLASKKITTEAHKTRSIVKEFALDPEELSRNLRLQMETDFNNFQRLHSTRYAELNLVLSEALNQQNIKDQLYLSEIDALKIELEAVKSEVSQIRSLVLTGDISSDVPTIVFDEKLGN